MPDARIQEDVSPEPGPRIPDPPPPALPACPDAEPWLVAVCVKPALPRVGKVTIEGKITGIGIGADCLDSYAASPEPRRGFELTDAAGNRRQFVILMPGLELPFKVGDAVTAIYDNKRQFDYVFPGWEFSVLGGGDLLLHVGEAHYADKLGAPGGIGFELEAGTCLSTNHCGRTVRHPLKATSAAASASIALRQITTLAGYRVLHAGATSELPPRTCADYSGDWVRVALSRITPP
jgi:hypothetical protein